VLGGPRIDFVVGGEGRADFVDEVFVGFGGAAEVVGYAGEEGGGGFGTGDTAEGRWVSRDMEMFGDDMQVRTSRERTEQ
jgi:hypothetical protein